MLTNARPSASSNMEITGLPSSPSLEMDPCALFSKQDAATGVEQPASRAVLNTKTEVQESSDQVGNDAREERHPESSDSNGEDPEELGARDVDKLADDGEQRWNERVKEGSYERTSSVIDAIVETFGENFQELEYIASSGDGRKRHDGKGNIAKG